jgi:hypothetical protein
MVFMRRLALLGLLSLLPACQFAGDPTAGFGGFIADTHTWHLNANQPEAVTENEKLAKGEPVKIEPVGAESGEVWPGPPAPIPTMQDVQKLNDLDSLPPPSVPAEPPPALFPQNMPPKQ